MALTSSHQLVSVAFADDKAQVPICAQLLDRAFKMLVPAPLAIDGKLFTFSAHPDQAAAQTALVGTEDRVHGERPGQQLSHQDHGLSLCVAITSQDDPSFGRGLVAEALQPDVLNYLLRAAEQGPAHQACAEFESAAGISLRQVLLDLVTYEVRLKIDDAIPSAPWKESVDATGGLRGYVREIHGVDPVDTSLTDPYAAINATMQANLDYLANQDAQVVREAMRHWDEERDDLSPSLDVLGYQEADVRDQLRDWCEEALAGVGGAVDLELDGTVAIGASPSSPSDGSIYITFDGLSSSSLNAVTDENYMAMLDTLQVDVRGWIDYLANRAGLQPNWNFDLQKLADDHRHLARHDAVTGYHWASAGTQLRTAIRDVLFFSADPGLPDNLVSHQAAWLNAMERLQALESQTDLNERWHRSALAMRQMYADLGAQPLIAPVELAAHRADWLEALQRLVELEVPSAEEERDDRSYWTHELRAMQSMYASWDLSQAALTPNIEDLGHLLPTADYLLDIALEVLKAQAWTLDRQWLCTHGIAPEDLASIESSSAQRETFPQLADMPSYYAALVNLPAAGSLDYDWQNDPQRPHMSPLLAHADLAEVLDNCNHSSRLDYEWTNAPHRPRKAPMVDHSGLVEVLDNCNYSGRLVFAFDCDLKQLNEIGSAVQRDTNGAIEIKNAYLHIHDYVNGAGDGVRLDGSLRIPLEDLQSGKWQLHNDSTHRHGIQAVFGQFLASSCTVKLCQEPTQSELDMNSTAEETGPAFAHP